MTMTQMRIDVRLTEREVLAVLVERGSEPLSLEDIAAQIDCSGKTVYRAVNRLEAAGRIRRTYAGGASKTVYEVIDADA